MEFLQRDFHKLFSGMHLCRMFFGIPARLAHWSSPGIHWVTELFNTKLFQKLISSEICLRISSEIHSTILNSFAVSHRILRSFLLEFFLLFIETKSGLFALEVWISFALDFPKSFSQYWGVSESCSRDFSRITPLWLPPEICPVFLRKILPNFCKIPLQILLGVFRYSFCRSSAKNFFQRIFRGFSWSSLRDLL